MSDVYIGIDPGLSGAMAYLDPDGFVLDVCDLPLIDGPADSKGKVQKEIDADTLAYLLRADSRADKLHIGLEKVHAMPGQGVTSMFNFGQSYGAIKAVIRSLGLEFTLVSPQEWKKEFQLINKDRDRKKSDVKLDAVRKAIDYFSLHNSLKATAKYSGQADALWIAEFVRLRNMTTF